MYRMSQEDQALELARGMVSFKRIKDEYSALRARLARMGDKFIEYGKALQEADESQIRNAPSLDILDTDEHYRMVKRIGELKNDMDRWRGILKPMGWVEPG